MRSCFPPFVGGLGTFLFPQSPRSRVKGLVWCEQTPPFLVCRVLPRPAGEREGGREGGEKGFAVDFPAVEDLIFLSLSRMRETSQKVLGYLWSYLHFNL